MANEIPHWNAPGSDDSWDNLLLGGEFIPGVATVECEDSWKLDFQKAKGKDGYKVKDEGYEGASVDITILIDSKDHLEALAKVLPTLRPPKKGGARQPLEISHPSALVAGITAIAIEKIKIRMPSAVDGWTIEIKAKEWLAAPKSNSGLGGVKGGGAQSCAVISGQLQEAHWKLSQIASQLQYAQQTGGLLTGAGKALEKQFAQQEAKVLSLQSQLGKCAGGGGVTPPSESAVDNGGFGTDEAALAAAA